MLDYFQVTKTQTDFISDLPCSNKHKKLIHTTHLSLHDYLGSALPGKGGTILSATMIGLDQVDIAAYLLLYDLHSFIVTLFNDNK